MHNKSPENIEDFIVRHILGLLSQDENEHARKLIESDAEAKRLYDSYVRVYECADGEAYSTHFDADAAIDRFHSEIKIERKSRTRQIRSLLYGGAVAASIALIVVFLFNHNLQKDPYKTIAVYTETSNIELEDGSILDLNVHSAMSYRVSADNQRSVKIDSGEVFFTVAKDSLRPFVISTSSATVTVLGTKFNVNARSLDSTIVTVTEGRVLVEDHFGHSVLVTAGQETAAYSSGNEMSVGTDVNTNHLFWKTKILHFDEAPFSEFIPAIEDAYKTEILLDTANTSNCRLTSQFANQPLSAVVEIICASFGAEYSLNRDSSYTIMLNTPCN